MTTTVIYFPIKAVVNSADTARRVNARCARCIYLKCINSKACLLKLFTDGEMFHKTTFIGATEC